MIESGRTSDFDHNWYPVAGAELSQPAGRQASQATGTAEKRLTFFVNHA